MIHDDEESPGPTLSDCECCLRKDQPIAGVASSGLGPISLRYCEECAVELAEPAWLIKSVIDDCGGKENVAPEFLDGTTFFKDGKYIKMREFQS